MGDHIWSLVTSFLLGTSSFALFCCFFFLVCLPRHAQRCRNNYFWKCELRTKPLKNSQHQGQKGTAQVVTWVLTVDKIYLPIEHSGSVKHPGNSRPLWREFTGVGTTIFHSLRHCPLLKTAGCGMWIILFCRFVQITVPAKLNCLFKAVDQAVFS